MKLEEYIKKNKLTIKEFAEISLLTPACVHHVISGRRKNIALLTALCIQLGSNNQVKLVDLIGYDRLRILGNKIQKNIDKNMEKKNG
jgi:predicted transcriptional regulator